MRKQMAEMEWLLMLMLIIASIYVAPTGGQPPLSVYFL